MPGRGGGAGCCGGAGEGCGGGEGASAAAAEHRFSSGGAAADGAELWREEVMRLEEEVAEWERLGDERQQ